MAIKIQGHRGVRHRCGIPESSKLAFNTAIQEGVDGLEWDVVWVQGGGVEGCEDGELPVTHTEKELMNRDTYPELNNDKHITEFSWTQLKPLKLNDHQGMVTEESLPANNEILDLISKHRKANPNHMDERETDRAKNFVANIEIKYPENPSPEYITKVVNRVVRDIKDRIKKDGWTEANFEVRSFNMDILQAARERLDQEGLSKVAIGALIAGTKADGWDIKDFAAFKRELDDIKLRGIRPDNISLTWQSFTPLNIGAIKERFGETIKLNAWTWEEEKLVHPAEREEFIRSLVNNKIDTIITDDPGRVRQEIDAYITKNAEWGVRGTSTG